MTLAETGNLLHHLARDLSPARVGRAGLPVHERIAPSAGGLHPCSFVCVSNEEGLVLLYDPLSHAFLPFKGDQQRLTDINRSDVEQILGAAPGVTVRIVADVSLVSAAYENPETLILRDAGALLPVAGMLAEWLGLLLCPLGFLGSSFVDQLSLPRERFMAVGGFQLSSNGFASR